MKFTTAICLSLLLPFASAIPIAHSDPQLPSASQRALGEEAQQLNFLFESLTLNSACSAGELACVDGVLSECGGDNKWENVPIQNRCGGSTQCFAVPSNDRVIVECILLQQALNLIAETGAQKGISKDHGLEIDFPTEEEEDESDVIDASDSVCSELPTSTIASGTDTIPTVSISFGEGLSDVLPTTTATGAPVTLTETETSTKTSSPSASSATLTEDPAEATTTTVFLVVVPSGTTSVFSTIEASEVPSDLLSPIESTSAIDETSSSSTDGLPTTVSYVYPTETAENPINPSSESQSGGYTPVNPTTTDIIAPTSTSSTPPESSSPVPSTLPDVIVIGPGTIPANKMKRVLVRNQKRHEGHC